MGQGGCTVEVGQTSGAGRSSTTVLDPTALRTRDRWSHLMAALHIRSLDPSFARINTPEMPCKD